MELMQLQYGNMSASAIVSALFLFCTIGVGLTNASPFITADPPTIFPSTTKTLTIECNIRPLLAAIKSVYALQINKNVSGQVLSLASVTDKGIVADSGFEAGRMNVTGVLDTSGGQGPYIRLTIDGPDKDDGTYICSASAMDKTGAVLDLSYQTVVNVADVIADQLMRMVVDLSLEISGLREENKNLQDNFTDYETRLQDLENTTPCNCTSDNNNTNNNNNNNIIPTGSTSSSQSSLLIAQTLDEIKANFTQDLIIYDNRLTDFTDEIAQLRSNQSDLSLNVTRFGQTAMRLVSDMAYTSSKYGLIENRLKVVETISTEQYGEIAKLSDDQKSFAFSYFYPDMDQAQSLLYFRYKLIDSVPSYDSQSGEFTAPSDGLYLLTLHIATADGSLDVAIKVRQDLVAYAITSFSDGIQQGSTTTVVRMSKGDKAIVKVAKIRKVPVHLEKNGCSFTGVYLGPV